MLFGVFAGRVEGRGIAVAESSPVGRASLRVTAGFKLAELTVKIEESAARAEFVILLGGFVIAGNGPDAAGLLGENRRANYTLSLHDALPI